MFTFAWPSMILLLALPLLARYLLPRISGRIGKAVIRFPHMETLKKAFGGSSLQLNLTLKAFLLLASLFWICLTLALMQPQIVNKREDVQTEGYDIMLAVDLSGSMQAMDFSSGWTPVTRLDIAKSVVGNFVKERNEDRIGLVLFGDFAYQYAPLTMDHDAVVKMLNETVISMAGDGTAIGDAIGLSVKALRDRPEKSRVIILLTDGEDTASSIPPIQAAKLAKQYGIKIYTIGIGKKGPVMVPGPMGMMTRTVKNENLLRIMAETTGGSSFEAADTTTLVKVYEKINQLEKTKVESREYVIRTPLFRYPLAVALLFLACIALLPLLLQGDGRRAHA
ncbi:MAG: VWA domain-containing protein [Alphaproteobacteria bacterium]|nr:VWA domain-containing protein [Alphaproteobacteria bacterium]